MKDSRSFALLRMTRVKGFGLPLELSLLVTQIPFGNDNKRGLVEELVVARRVRGGMEESRSFALLRMTRVKGFGLPFELSLLKTQIPFGNDNKRGLVEELVVGPEESGWHEGQQILRVAQDDKGEGFWIAF